MTTTTPESRGRLAYTAYCKRRNFKAVDGSDLPIFDDLQPGTREAWIAAAGLIWDLATTGRATL